VLYLVCLDNDLTIEKQLIKAKPSKGGDAKLRVYS